MARGGTLDEFEIIARIFAPLAEDRGGKVSAFGLGDDAATLTPASGQSLVASTDTIIETVHFLAQDPPAAIGWKALAVNLSDLAAKAATPLAYLLDLALPADPRHPARTTPWLEAFAAGLKALQQESGIALAGGDTTATPGPLTISITALGLVGQGEAVLRSGARAGDVLCLSGSIGDACLGLSLLREPDRAGDWGLSDDDSAYLIDRYRRPRPRNALAPALRAHASAAIDISDGLAADLGKLSAASRCGACIEASAVPFSSAAQKVLHAEPSLLTTLLSAGDDYEVLAAVPPGEVDAFLAGIRASGIAVTILAPLGNAAESVAWLDAAGRPLAFDRLGYTHFGA